MQYVSVTARLRVVPSNKEPLFGQNLTFNKGNTDSINTQTAPAGVYRSATEGQCHHNLVFPGLKDIG